MKSQQQTGCSIKGQGNDLVNIQLGRMSDNLFFVDRKLFLFIRLLTFLNLTTVLLA